MLQLDLVQTLAFCGVALLAGYGLLGKAAPSYIALSALPVTQSNLLSSWKTVYNAEAPASVRASLK